MDKETDARLAHLEGRLVASMAAIKALIAMQPDPERAIRIVDTVLEQFVAHTLASPQPEAFVDALTSWAPLLLPSERELETARTAR